MPRVVDVAVLFGTVVGDLVVVVIICVVAGVVGNMFSWCCCGNCRCFFLCCFIVIVVVIFFAAAIAVFVVVVFLLSLSLLFLHGWRCLLTALSLLTLWSSRVLLLQVLFPIVVLSRCLWCVCSWVWFVCLCYWLLFVNR